MGGAAGDTDRQGSGTVAALVASSVAPSVASPTEPGDSADGFDAQDARHEKIFSTGSHLLRDPFSDATRERQKYLLLAALITLCLSRSAISIDQWKPEDVEIEIHIASQSLSYIFSGITSYLMLLFGVGAWQELKTSTFELAAGMPGLRRLFLEAVTTPAQLGEAWEKALNDGKPFKDAWEKATADDAKMQEALEVSRESVRKRMEKAHELHAKKLEEINDSESEGERAEAERYSDELSAIDVSDAKISARSAASSLKLQRQRDRLRKKYGADERNEKMTALAIKSVGSIYDKTGESAQHVFETLVRHLRWRRWVEFLLPLALGFIAICFGIFPLKVQ